MAISGMARAASEGHTRTVNKIGMVHSKSNSLEHKTLSEMGKLHTAQASE